MKNIKFIYLKITVLLGLIFSVAVGCVRNPSDEAVLATYPKTAEVFTDGFSAGLGYGAFSGTKLNAFTVDKEVKHAGTASMRFDIPNVNDPEGAFAGGSFIDGSGRDLTDYDALTFWAKSSQSGTINEVGFGNDFGENKYMVTMNNVVLGTNWKKYIIPLPDASKLKFEKGMFYYAEGPEDGKGYTFWIDDLKFEKLGTIAHSQPAILNGSTATQQSFVGVNITLSGLTQTFNMPTGVNQTVSVAPNYFTFSSSNTAVATVNSLGKVSVIGAGTAVISATLGGVDASGSLTIQSLGAFTLAPTPTQIPSNVISIFSNAYTNVPVEYYNGYWAPYQTTLGQDDIHVNGDDIIAYSKLNFVGIQFTKPTINVSQMTHLHVDVQVKDAIPVGGYVIIKLQDIGPDNTFGTSDDSAGQITYRSPTLITGKWVSLEIPLSSFPGLIRKANLAQVVFITDATIKDIFVDNIYFHK